MAERIIRPAAIQRTIEGRAVCLLDQVVIDKLINTNKEIEAIYFVHYSGLSNRFPSESLLKEYHQASRRKSSSISEDGNNSPAALQESNNLEMTALRSIIKCVESCNLESKFSTSELKRRLAKLEKVKADRKKPAVLKKFWSKRSAPRDLSQPDSTYCGSMLSYMLHGCSISDVRGDEGQEMEASWSREAVHDLEASCPSFASEGCRERSREAARGTIWALRGVADRGEVSGARKEANEKQKSIWKLRAERDRARRRGARSGRFGGVATEGR
ncbi:hypothetical protein ZIOFF_074792 [Zingiber officinale]|uniref:FRIGIDA-like protein n=1 Tax=Zingiber officinale TaxID=94328 RepID=A0A8J5C2G4_ZINOF|nr:hypothetical protein ZIOFF_074792 [Zingiber officinale]